MTRVRLSFWRRYCSIFGVISIRRVSLALAAAVVVLFVGRPVLAQSPDSKIDHSLQSSLHSGAATQKVIITVDDPDLRIAGIALANDLVLVSGNQRRFSRVPELQLENWLS